MKITFYGAVEEVTGSRYLVEHDGTKILVDCGMFQGDDESNRKKDPIPVDPRSIDAVLLTHAHIDHTGYLPRLVKDGFKGKIYCSDGTRALCSILLMDSAYLEEERAREAGDSVEPLYTIKDAEKALQFFKVVPFDTEFKLDSFTATLISSGHILGSAFVVLSDGKDRLTFSGDLGRPEQLIMKEPPHLTQTDYLVIESTYGNRLHSEEDPIEVIGKIVQQTIARGGVLIIPSFAVARTQEILYILYQLREKGALPKCPIFLDSPMAIKVTDLMCNYLDELKISSSLCKKAFSIATYTPETHDSIKINKLGGPAIIIAGSGMAEGGRVMHHFKHRISENKNTVLFVGYQAEGTLGRALTEGEKKIKLFGKNFKVHATIKKIDMLSAHADYNEILDWLSYFKPGPKKVFITHGELDAAELLKKKIEERFGWEVVVPKYSESYDLK